MNYAMMAEALSKILMSEHTSILSESYLQHILYKCFSQLNLMIKVEEYTKQGMRFDIVLDSLEQAVYVFELKYKYSAQAALDQLIARQYCRDICVEATKIGKYVVGVGLE